MPLVLILCIPLNDSSITYIYIYIKEQENLLITLILKIENDELKDEYLKKLKKTMKHDFQKPVKPKISLDETLERFSK
jgi:F0F1-type ATP synthase delta subunit